MAIFHLQLRPIQRSKHRSVIQIVSYVTGLQLRSPRLGKSYRRRTVGDVVRFGCVGSGLPMQCLWAKAEFAEKRKNSVEGRHLIVALPRENSHEDHWKMLIAMAGEIGTGLGVPVVVALHDNVQEVNKPRNPHGHLVFSTRIWDERAQSFLGKTRSLDVQQTGSVIIENYRKKWEDIVNHGLPAGVKKLSRLSHARAGRSRIPRRHLGEEATRMEKNGILTTHGNYNRKLDKLDRIVAQKATVEDLLTLGPKMRHAELQRPNGLERELAIANASIASMPSLRTAASAEAITKQLVDTTTSRPQIFTPMTPQEASATSKNVVIEDGSLAAGLMPQSLEAELLLVLEALDVTAEKDLSP